MPSRSDTRRHDSTLLSLPGRSMVSLKVLCAPGKTAIVPKKQEAAYAWCFWNVL